jgi:hypothetical protein
MERFRAGARALPGAQFGDRRKAARRYVELHRLLAVCKPRSVLEFGSGTTTGAFASYARRSGAYICTVEHDEAWLGNTRRALGSLASCVSFVVAPFDGERGGEVDRVYYRFVPSREFDFVYVDGPPVLIDGVSAALTAVCWNIVEMIRSGLAPRYIAVDVRVPAARFLAARFSNQYIAYLSDGPRVVAHAAGRGRRHSFFVRRDLARSM